MIAENDRVVAYWSLEGTHHGELFGVPATGRPISATVVGLLRFDDGKLAEYRAMADFLPIMQQIGALPAPA
jgi:predicted ester cyclase